METSILSVKNLQKTYTTKKDTVEALRDVTLQAGQGETIGIMGPSGCGKTVLAQIIAGIETVTAGELTLFGEDCSKGVPNRIKRRMGFIYQDHNLLPWRSVEGNLRFPLEIFGLEKQKEYLDRIPMVLDMVGLLEYRTCLPQELSGGMMQRVGLARALVYNPELLIMDQPFGALDAITRRKLRYDFMRLFESMHKTFVVITNSIDEVLLLSNRIYVMTDAPGTILETVSVDVPFQDRTTDVAENEKFNGVRAHMLEIIKKQYS